ncbi:MAG: PKD domain-containing protein [Chitinophagales bacterium]
MTPTTLGNHPYYCTPHGAPNGVGMSGVITVVPDCNNNQVSATLTFNEANGGFGGFNVLVDGTATADSPYTYAASGSNSVNVLINGDGQNHTVEVQDVDNGTCAASTSISTVDCSFTPPCELSLSATQTSGCNTANEVPLELTITANNEGASGFNILVDGVITSTQTYNTSGTTIVNLNLSGDGQSHTIEVQDVDDSTCSASTTTILPDCFAVCDLSNLTLLSDEPQTHIVEVKDFEFVPKELTVNVGDVVRFEWTGAIPHTTTSDVLEGVDSWDSGLLGQGSIFEVTIQTEGVHSYYCIPHGAPGGIGMSGVITALWNGESNSVPVLARFEAENGGFEGYRVLVDGTVTEGSPYSYSDISVNEVVVNVAADGLSHIIEVEDVGDVFCSIEGAITTIDCCPEPLCSLSIASEQISDCDFDGQIEVEVSIEGIEVGENGFNLLIDGNLLQESPFNYAVSGTTVQTISMVGTGTSRQIEVQDVDDANCRATTSIVAPLCGEFCEVLNLKVATEEAVKYVVEVRDFEFFPKDIEVRVGDTVSFVWTGAIPHSATSDAISGADVWNSGIIGQGSVFEVIIQTVGNHPYYCIPHGGPGGIGMVGTIRSLPKCTVNTANVVASFEVTNGSPNGYRAFLDGALVSETAFVYQNAMGVNYLNLPILGDGETHILTLQDWDNQVCAASVAFEVPICGSGGCEIVKLAAFTGQSVRHIVEVRDFEFFPKEIDVTVGETVRFVWKGVIPHTTTSDATLGADVWDSDLLGEGAVFDVVIQTVGEHPYYCTPHGGPNGIGMSGVIHAAMPCENDEMTVQLDFEAINGGDVGFNVYVDGSLLPESPYPYDNSSGVNSQIIRLEGDGAVHTVTVQDVESVICADNAQLFLPQCGAACEISNISASVNEGKKHTIEVRDFDFFPANLTVNVGDVVEFVWTGAVPHTTTSDATAGVDVWDSGLLGQGAGYEVVIQSVGEHWYYCIPHGAPNGVGMAGVIAAIDPCENGNLPVRLFFNALSTGFNGFNVLVDAQLTANSPLNYNGMGQNEVMIEVTGDGETHLITVQDVDDPTCQETIELQMPNCNDVCLGFHAAFSFNVVAGSLVVQFNDASTVGVDNWMWDFGDGMTSMEENPIHTFENEGSYEVCLTVEDVGLECSDTFCTAIAVGEVVCEANFEVENEGLTVEFLDISVSSDVVVEWSWDFGDGFDSDLPNPTHTYSDLGTYTVCLEITTADCTHQYCETLDLTDVCLLFETDFAYEVNHGDLTVQLFDLTQGGVDTWLWGFGDGVTSNVQNPTHAYSQAGNYTVCLLARNSETDCFEPTCKVVTVGDVVGIEDLDLRQVPLVIFPNPSSRENVTWRIVGIDSRDFGRGLLLQLYDLQGKLVYGAEVIGRETVEVRLEENLVLAEGMYLMRLEGGDRRYFGRVVLE